jgi:hypothetical protein
MAILNIAQSCHTCGALAAENGVGVFGMRGKTNMSSQFLTTPKNPGMLPDLSPLEDLVDRDVSPRDVCGVLAKMFQVQQTEVAILRLDRGLLNFIYPDELRSAGSIPISSSSIAAHTAISKKSEIFNNFARVKHASVFETVKLGTSEGIDTSEPLPIQKLMSAPVIDENARVLGVIQISRKGSESNFAGADFSREDLHELEMAAGILAASPVMRES